MVIETLRGPIRIKVELVVGDNKVLQITTNTHNLLLVPKETNRLPILFSLRANNSFVGGDIFNQQITKGKLRSVSFSPAPFGPDLSQSIIQLLFAFQKCWKIQSETSKHLVCFGSKSSISWKV